MRAALSAATPLRILVGPVFELNHSLIDPLAIRVKRLNQEHGLISRVTQRSTAHPLLSGRMWLKTPRVFGIIACLHLECSL